MAIKTRSITVRKYVTDLLPGDIVQAGEGELLEVANVDACAAFTIVDFTDGTATPPLGNGTYMVVQKTRVVS